MTPSATTATPATNVPAGRPDGNDVDVHYLLEARAALHPIMDASTTAAHLAGSHQVRTLARHALSEQADQLAAITDCLVAWGRGDAAQPARAPVSGMVGLHGHEVDVAFAALLTAHAHASLVSARIEMVAGASRVARPIAEAAIHEQDRRLAALRLLPVPPAVGR